MNTNNGKSSADMVTPNTKGLLARTGMPLPIPTPVTIAEAAALPEIGATPSDPLAQLAMMIAQPSRVPKIAQDASAAMKKVHETVAGDIERVAQDHVDRAIELQQQARTFAEIVRQSGEVLCAKIEAETTKGYQISQVMKMARDHHVDPVTGGAEPPLNRPERA